MSSAETSPDTPPVSSGEDSVICLRRPSPCFGQFLGSSAFRTLNWKVIKVEICLLWKPIYFSDCFAFRKIFQILRNIFLICFFLAFFAIFNWSSAITLRTIAGIKEFTRFWALLMFGIYSCCNIIVLLNMLIAMMSNSYQSISVNNDR